MLLSLLLLLLCTIVSSSASASQTAGCWEITVGVSQYAPDQVASEHWDAILFNTTQGYNVTAHANGGFSFASCDANGGSFEIQVANPHAPQPSASRFEVKFNGYVVYYFYTNVSNSDSLDFRIKSPTSVHISRCGPDGTFIPLDIDIDLSLPVIQSNILISNNMNGVAFPFTWSILDEAGVTMDQGSLTPGDIIAYNVNHFNSRSIQVLIHTREAWLHRASSPDTSVLVVKLVRGDNVLFFSDHSFLYSERIQYSISPAPVHFSTLAHIKDEISSIPARSWSADSKLFFFFGSSGAFVVDYFLKNASGFVLHSQFGAGFGEERIFMLPHAIVDMGVYGFEVVSGSVLGNSSWGLMLENVWMYTSVFNESLNSPTNSPLAELVAFEVFSNGSVSFLQCDFSTDLPTPTGDSNPLSRQTLIVIIVGSVLFVVVVSIPFVAMFRRRRRAEKASWRNVLDERAKPLV